VGGDIAGFSSSCYAQNPENIAFRFGTIQENVRGAEFSWRKAPCPIGFGIESIGVPAGKRLDGQIIVAARSTAGNESRH
jgi:hypothetical protein